MTTRSPVDVGAAADLLETQGLTIAALFGGLSPRLAAWRPAADGWSAHTVLCHLLDEERGDFRPRLVATLEDEGRPWPGIDPEGWVTARGYAERSTSETLDAFVAERRTSVLRVRALSGAPWDHAHEHPTLGRITARDLLAAWLDHDRLHLRQVLGTLHAAGDLIVPGGRPDYAGTW